MGFKDSAAQVATTLQEQIQNNTQASTSKTQTANVSASDRSNAEVYPEQVFDHKPPATSPHSQSN